MQHGSAYTFGSEEDIPDVEGWANDLLVEDDLQTQRTGQMIGLV